MPQLVLVKKMEAEQNERLRADRQRQSITLCNEDRRGYASAQHRELPQCRARAKRVRSAFAVGEPTSGRRALQRYAQIAVMLSISEFRALSPLLANPIALKAESMAYQRHFMIAEMNLSTMLSGVPQLFIQDTVVRSKSRR
jgi:hypothetical protein